jgi:hypothetical protein
MSTVAGIAQGVTDQGRDGSVVTQAVATFPYALFCRGLLPEVGTLPDTPGAAGDEKSPAEGIVTRPYDYLYNFIRALTTTKIPDKLRSMPAINFFVRWMRRNQFNNKFVALPFLEEVYDTVEGKLPERRADQPAGLAPILRAALSSFAVKALRDQASPEYSGASAFDMLKKVLDVMCLEMEMLPTPAYVKTDLRGSILGPGPVGTLNTVATPSSFGTGEQLQRTNTAFSEPYVSNPKEPGRLTNYFVKPQCLFSLAPACNVIFPSMTHQAQYQESYATQPTRLYVEDNELAGASSGLEPPDKIMTNAVTVGYPPAVDKRLQERVTKQPWLTGKNLLLYPEEFYKGPVTAVTAAPPWLFYFQAQLQTDPLGPDGLGPPDPAGKTVTPADGESITEKDLYRLYAQHEYFRQRYEKRNGSVDIDGFDPYPVPGLPLVVFDDFQSRLHVVGYLMTVSHAIAARSVSTTLSYTYGRTIYEFLTDIANEIDNPQNPKNAGKATAAAPPEPIPEIRDILQHEWRADQFYQQLLWRRTAVSAETSREQPAVCRIRDLLAFVNPDGTIEPIKIEGTNEETQRQQRAALAKQKPLLAPLDNPATLEQLVRTQTGSLVLGLADVRIAFRNLAPILDALDQIEQVAQQMYRLSLGSAVNDFYEALHMGFLSAKDALATLLAEIDAAIAAPAVTTHNLAGAAQRELTPTPGLEPLFDSFDAGMKYCARPICTLEEYISFIGGVREGANDDFSYDDGSGMSSARYYTRIRYLKGATAADVATAKQQNLPIDTPASAMGGSGVSSQTGEKPATGGSDGAGEAVPLDFPVMRAEWDKVMLQHRAKVYSTYKLSR